MEEATEPSAGRRDLARIFSRPLTELSAGFPSAADRGMLRTPADTSAADAVCSEDEHSVKSAAMVVYGGGVAPLTFQRLDTNVDLSKPPANWCRARSPVERSILRALLAKKSPFSSFDMANDKLELLDSMDVISDSENIKKLLKMPYSQAPVSLMVHRVGRTLLLDDFDVHRHLLRRQREDWQWLKKFYADLMAEAEQQRASTAAGGSQDLSDAAARDSESSASYYRGSSAPKPTTTRPSHPKRRGQRADDRNMLSKFLYYSIQSAEETSADQQKSAIAPPQLLHALDAAVKGTVMPPDIHHEPALGRAGEAMSASSQPDKAEEDSGNSSFQRTLVWNFEDIKMLIGTDLPIFGGGSQPAVSLRLRDASTPINILTGLEYWLDNLMCNVPEVAMCYHLNGIVQQYEKIRTEDLPRYKGSQFSPKRITDVAQNILSFLKSKAAREGHTYWLYKEGNGEVVKLYDLTSLCDTVSDAKQNPFTAPLGMLLYRVARNMLQQQSHDSHKPKKVPIICGLLGNCLLLLDPEHHPQVVTAANMLLSDLYLVDYTEDEVGGSESDDTDEQQHWSSSEDEGGHSPAAESVPEKRSAAAVAAAAAAASAGTALHLPSQVNVGALSSPGSTHAHDNGIRHFVPFPTGLGDRLSLAVQHVADALVCLDDSFEKHLQDCWEGGVHPPGDVIPLTYAPLQAEHKAHLLRNAVAALAGLAEWEHLAGSHALALRHAGLALRCRASLESLTGSTSWQGGGGGGECDRRPEDAGCSLREHWQPGQLLQLLRLCGDAHVSLARQSSSSSGRTEAGAEEPLGGGVEEYELKISASAGRELPLPADYEWASQRHADAGESLKVAVKCYDCVLAKLPGVSPSAAATVIDSTGGDEATATPHSAHVQVTRRCANAKNEIANLEMNAAAAQLLTRTGAGNQVAGAQSLETVRVLVASSRQYLEQGLAAFTTIGDDVNAALLMCNSGRLLRIEAEAHAWQMADDVAAAAASGSAAAAQRSEFSPIERELYAKATELYARALVTVKARDRTAIREHIRGEIAGAYFSWASLLQDYPPLSVQSKDEVEREFVDLSMKALKYCCHQMQQPRHTAAPPQQQSAARCRCAAVHHRLASMYHHAYRTQQDNDQKKRQLRSLAEQHYSKTAERLLAAMAAGHPQEPAAADLALDLLRVQLERVALTEFLWLDQIGQPCKIIKPLKASLLIFADDHMSDAVNALELYVQSTLGSAEDKDTTAESGRLSECGKLLTIAASRLRFILLHINKASSAASKKRQTEGAGLPVATRYRMLYEKSLLLAKDEQAGVALQELAAKFKALLTALRSQRDEMGS